MTSLQASNWQVGQRAVIDRRRIVTIHAVTPSGRVKADDRIFDPSGDERGSSGNGSKLELLTPEIEAEMALVVRGNKASRAAISEIGKADDWVKRNFSSWGGVRVPEQFDSLLQMMEAFPDEQTCINHLRAIRWKNGAFCPHCGGATIYHFSDNRTHKCGDCRLRFSIKVGTIFEDTKLPLRKWFMAIWLITSHKKGIASTTLAKDLKITQKSAWFVLHRLRYAARTKSFAAPLEGDVEVDETYVARTGKGEIFAHKPPTKSV